MTDTFLRALAGIAPASAFFLAAGYADADPVTITCHGNAAAEEIVIAYEGGATGTLGLTAPFGTASLPATRQDRADENGGMLVFGIRAFGPAEAVMPPFAEIETCVAAADPSRDRELARILCIDQAQPSGEAVPVALGVSAALIEPPRVEVWIERTYRQGEIDGKDVTVSTSPKGCEVTAQ